VSRFRVPGSARFAARRRPRVISLAAVTVAAAVLAGCAGSNNSGSGGSGSSDTLTVVTPDTAIVWALDNGFGGLEAEANTQATLLRKPYEKSATGNSLQQNVNQFDPYLASGYTVSNHGLTYTFHLRDAISAAGNHLTSEDVLWSYERKFHTPTSVSPGVSAPEITDPARQFKIIDKHTISITVAQAGYGLTLLALLSDLTSQIYDSTMLKQHATASDPYAVKWSATHPNYGFGPYEVKNYQPGVSVLLTANPHWILGAPKIKNILMKIIPDAGTRANAVQNGDADLAEDLQPADLVNLAKGPNTKIATVDNPNAFMELPLLTNKAPFSNTQVRQAMGWAVPYQQIIQNVYHGLAIRKGPDFLRTDTPGYDGSGLTPFSYDPAKAKKLLAAAGYPHGLSFTLTVSAAEPDMQQAAVQIQTYAKAAGFTITINQVPASAFAAGRTDKTFQAFLLRDYAITLTPGYELLVYTAPNGGNNLAAWYNASFYAAMAKGNAAGNPLSAEAGKLWNAADRIYINDAPILFIAQIQPSVAMRSNVDGFAWRSDNWIDFSNLYFAK
jgi:peptide/nickel transport system substrate-binding protein